MKYLFFIVLFGIHSFSFAQFIERESYFSSAGNYADIGSLKLQSNIGELMADVYSSPQHMLTQGFVQPDLQIITSIGTAKPVSEVTIFPNPFSSRLFVQVNALSNTDLKVEVYDIMGKAMLVQASVEIRGGLSFFTFDLGSLASGIYVVHVSSVQNRISQSYKVNKI